MSAKEMFEKLGYIKKDVEDPVTGEIFEHDYKYVKFDGTWLREILFNDSTKLIHMNTELHDRVENDILYFELLQAVNKQIEELGWNND